MRFFKWALAAGLVLGTLTAETRAQYYTTSSYVSPYVVNPYVSPYVPPPIYAYSAYVSPYGYANAYNYGAYPTPWGYNTFANTTTYVRPIFTGPLHSAYWDPFANRYRYGPGSLNTPRYLYYYGY